MPEKLIIEGFSKLSRSQKIATIKHTEADIALLQAELNSHVHPDPEVQKLYEGLTENAISNYHLPYSLAPNFLVNGHFYMVPMVTEESSVVAAASSAAKYWASRGGFGTRVLASRKSGQVHFLWHGSTDRLTALFNQIKPLLTSGCTHLTQRMEKRGGGITGMELVDKTALIPGYFQIHVNFETADSMGANFINTILEQLADTFSSSMEQFVGEDGDIHLPEVIMAILSNHAPECLVEAFAECPVKDLTPPEGTLTPASFANRLRLATEMARCDIYRAVTHNKGIYNGISAVILATGNDFRAVEAQGHAYASLGGGYKSLSEVHIEGSLFSISLRVPMTIGTTGGITRIHPLAHRSLKILGNPSATDLMQIAAATGLASNFNAIRSLVTTGIQKGHMRLHLSNILLELGATGVEAEAATGFFAGKTVSHALVAEFLKVERNKSPKLS